VRRVSSQAMNATSRKVLRALSLMSERLPIGVATRKSLPIGNVHIPASKALGMYSKDASGPLPTTEATSNRIILPLNPLTNK